MPGGRGLPLRLRDAAPASDGGCAANAEAVEAVSVLDETALRDAEAPWISAAILVAWSAIRSAASAAALIARTSAAVHQWMLRPERVAVQASAASHLETNAVSVIRSLEQSE